MVHLLPHIVKKLEKAALRHEVQKFDSGAVMVDFWINEMLYVIQIESKIIGLSKVDETTTPFDIIPEHSFDNERLFMMGFDSILSEKKSTSKNIEIEAGNFKTLSGFFLEAERVLTYNLGWETGRNLNAFNDLLRGGFGVHDYEEPIHLVWKNAAKSKRDLNTLIDGEPIYDALVNIIKSHAHIRFTEA